MKRTRMSILILSVILIATFLTLHTFGITGTGTRLAFQTISKSWGVGHSVPAYYVVQDFESWTRVWGQSEIPYVDFYNKTVIAVFMGMFPTGGYDIEIKEIIDTGLTIIIKVQRIYPGKRCLLIQVISYPCHIVSLDKIAKPTVFDITTITRNCD